MVATNNREAFVPSLWIFAVLSVDSFDVIASDNQQVTVSFVMGDTSQTITFIYANVSYVHRRALWDSSHHVFSNMIHPWAVIGNFNVVMGAHEKLVLPFNLYLVMSSEMVLMLAT